VVVYIDRQLAGPYGGDRYRYTAAPFEEGVPEQGYQGEANPRQTYRDSLKDLAGFARLGPAEQDEALAKIEHTHFFDLLRAHTIEGMFCDPIHGGNAGMIGWQLIGYAPHEQSKGCRSALRRGFPTQGGQPSGYFRQRHEVSSQRG
jgi:gluconate 2-dehydrogenase gamma chain